MASRAALLTGLAAAGVIAALVGFWIYDGAEPPAREAATEAPKPQGPLQLYCQFYVFVETKPRLALLFEVERRDGAPVFRQVYLAEDNGERTDYDGAETPRPEWRYDSGTEPQSIASTIKVPDNSQASFHEQDIAIQLYGYKPDRDNRTFFEASLKSFHFQNLPGKCRQAVG